MTSDGSPRRAAIRRSTKYSSTDSAGLTLDKIFTITVTTLGGGSGSGGSLLSASSGGGSASGASTADTTQTTPSEDSDSSNTEQPLSGDLLFAASVGDLSTTVKAKKSDDGDLLLPPGPELA